MSNHVSFVPPSPSSAIDLLYPAAPAGWCSAVWKARIFFRWERHYPTAPRTKAWQGTSLRAGRSWWKYDIIFILAILTPHRDLHTHAFSALLISVSGKFTYVEGWKAIQLANQIFGFNGWSSSVVDVTPDFVQSFHLKNRFLLNVSL